MIQSFLLYLAAAADPAGAPPAAPIVSAADPHPVVQTGSGLRLETLEPGSGPHPPRDGAVRVELEVRLADGTVVDAPPQPVGLSVSGVVPGLTEALLLMSKGGRYRAFVPARLAYGRSGSSDGSVPPDSDLVFTVRLLAIGRVARQTR